MRAESTLKTPAAEIPKTAAEVPTARVAEVRTMAERPTPIYVAAPPEKHDGVFWLKIAGVVVGILAVVGGAVSGGAHV
jgi:hypothetical protein